MEKLLLVILLFVTVFIVVVLLKRKKKENPEESQVSFQNMVNREISVTNNESVYVKLDLKKIPPFPIGIKNLEPNSAVGLTFNDFSVWFRADEDGMFYFSPTKDVLPYGCMSLYIDLGLVMSPESSKNYEFIPSYEPYICKPTIYVPIVAIDNSARMLKIGSDPFHPSYGNIYVGMDDLLS